MKTTSGTARHVASTFDAVESLGRIIKMLGDARLREPVGLESSFDGDLVEGLQSGEWSVLAKGTPYEHTSQLWGRGSQW